MARKVISCTATLAAGIDSRGKRALRTSDPWSISDSEAATSDCWKNVHTTIPTIRKIIGGGICRGVTPPGSPPAASPGRH
jgi:hypothetical protein